MDQRNTAVVRIVNSLEKKIEKFDEKILKMHKEILRLKAEQEEVIALLKQTLGKK